VEWYPWGWAAADDRRRRSARLTTHWVTGCPESQSVLQKRPGPRVARGAAVGAARGRNPGGTVGVGRGATSGSNPGGTSGVGWLGATVPVVMSRVPTVETVEPDSQRKSMLVGLGEATRGKAVLIKNHVSRDDQVVCAEIKVTVAFVIRRVAKEDTPGRVRSELMRRGCSSVRVTRTAENSEMLI
jgi:hypothetical protein